MTKLKICGVNSEAAFDASVAAGADYIGFVFFERSPRWVTPARAAALSARHSGGPLRVGLFVSPTLTAVGAALSELPLDALQLYGDLGLCQEIRRATGLPVWRAIGAGARADLPYASHGFDGLVIEAKAPPGAARPGGNAQMLDWSVLRGWRSPVPWLLAGGLNPANVAGAIAMTGAPGVDVSSGVEIAPGQKSPELIAAFAAASRGR